MKPAIFLMPVCGNEIVCPLASFDDYKRAVPLLEWDAPFNEERKEFVFSDERLDKAGRYTYRTLCHRAIYKGLCLKVKEVHRYRTGEEESPLEISYWLHVSGSLHKSYFGYNHNAFTFSDLLAQIEELETVLCIEPTEAIIQNIETGVNIPFRQTSPQVILDNLLVCNNKTFRPFESERIGREYRFSEYRLKVYDKGLQSEVRQNILRIELHFTRMRDVKELGICTLADLKDKGKVKSLLELITKAWRHVLLFDRELMQGNVLTKSDKDFLAVCQYGEFWQRQNETLTRAAVKKKRDRLTALIRQHGRDYKTEIEAQINEVWKTLFDEKRFTKSPDAKSRLKPLQVYEISVKMKGDNVNSFKCTCATCGREAKMQQ